MRRQWKLAAYLDIVLTLVLTERRKPMQNKPFMDVKKRLFGGKLSIRPATTDDISSMTSLLGELFVIETDFTPDIRRQRQGLADLISNPTANILVAAVNGEIIGMCTLQSLVSTAEGGIVGIVEDLVVSESYRRQGIGEKLLESIEQLARDKGMRRLQLLTNMENQASLNFYAKSEWDKTHMIALRKRFD